MGIFEGVSPVLLVLWLVSLVLVAVTTWMAGFGHTVGAHYLRHRQRRGRKPTVDEQIATAPQAVAAEDYGRLPAVDPEPTLRIAGRDPAMPQRVGLVLPDTYGPIRPEQPPRAEDLAQLVAQEQPAAERRDDDEPGEPPPSGGGLVATMVQPRVDLSGTKPWPANQGVLPAGWMMRAVGYLRPAIRVQQIPWPTREWVTSLRSDLAATHAELSARWERRPWLRTAPDAAARERGRHRVGVAAGTAEQRQVTA